MSNYTQGFYAPLPQNLSDSDSDKELTMEPVCEKYRTEDYLKKGRPLHLNGMSRLIDDEDDVKVHSVKTRLRVASLVIVCIILSAPIVIFLWVVPCGDLKRCPVKANNWEYEMLDVEFKGRINVIRGLYRRKWNLAIMYEACRNANVAKNGVISFVGKNGAVMWDFHQEPKPEFLDCSIIDMDKNSIYDCVLLDEKGLKAIETISGITWWHAHSHEPNVAITGLTNPLKLDDLNDDRINDILCIYQGNSFLVICGQTGRALVEVKLNCDQIHDVSLVQYDSRINYACTKNNKDKYYEIKVDNIREKYWNSNIEVKPTKIFSKPKEEIYVSGNRRLIVNNNGVGPDCHSTVSLYDDTEKQLSTWNYKGYIMKPQTVSFESTPENLASLKGHLNGFIFKLWEWKPPITIHSNYLNLSQSWQIIEKVLLITFNNTKVQVINASMTEITQLCKTDVDCQPSIENQEHSLLVEDVDEDGMQEIVSRTSTYTLLSDGLWHLYSYLKVFRLEDELPKLYNEN